MLFFRMNCRPAQESTIRYLCIHKPVYRVKMLKAVDVLLTAKTIGQTYSPFGGLIAALLRFGSTTQGIVRELKNEYVHIKKAFMKLGFTDAINVLSRWSHCGVGSFDLPMPLKPRHIS